MYQEMLAAGDYASAAEYNYLEALARDEFEEELAREQYEEECAKEEYEKELQRSSVDDFER